MPIYAYRCSKCGFEKEYLQKLSDPLLTVCPECGESSFSKLLTAAGFQLKGSGWYATDFKGGKSSAKPAESPDSGKSDAGKSDKPTTESAASGHACGTGACSTCS
ncbi:MAG TPA: zinc ribbon domain-containing protein [Burkholderiales bacterium]|nr:zinc ribbon domain-containing protein [Burkholderiales bacterium]